MSIAEIELYIEEKSLSDSEIIIIHSWKIINFLSLMLTNKLKDLNNYLPKKRIGVTTGRKKMIEQCKRKAKSLGHL
jgi:hypothetical protein